MSFGISVGDFLVVIKLATEIRKQFSCGPKQFSELSDEVKSLSVTLFDLAGEDDGVLCALGPKQADHFRTILEASQHVLMDLQDQLYSEYHCASIHTYTQCQERDVVKCALT